MKRLWVPAAALMCLALAVGSSQAAILPVGPDVTVSRANPNMNFSAYDYQGGLVTGYSGFAASIFYLKFTLPALEPGMFISDATLHGFYSYDDTPAYDQVHGIYLAAGDGWSETAITWTNQPGFAGSPIAVFNPASSSAGTYLSWDITPAADQQYKGDGVLSLVLKAIEESGSVNGAERFRSKEYVVSGGPTPFYIDFTVSAVPLPDALWLFGAGVVGLLLLRRKSMDLWKTGRVS